MLKDVSLLSWTWLLGSILRDSNEMTHDDVEISVDNEGVKADGILLLRLHLK